MAPQSISGNFCRGHLACKLSERSLSCTTWQVSLCVCVCWPSGKWQVAIARAVRLAAILFYKLQLAIAVQGECVNFLSRRHLQLIAIEACTHTHTHRQLLIVCVCVCAIPVKCAIALSTHIKLFDRVY